MTTTSKKTKRGGKTRPVVETKADASAGIDGGAAKPTTELSILIDLLARAEGASVAEMVEATGWQAHSVRGALAGTLKRKGHAISSEKADGVRRYRIGSAT